MLITGAFCNSTKIPHNVSVSQPLTDYFDRLYAAKYLHKLRYAPAKIRCVVWCGVALLIRREKCYREIQALLRKGALSGIFAILSRFNDITRIVSHIL